MLAVLFKLFVMGYLYFSCKLFIYTRRFILHPQLVSYLLNMSRQDAAFFRIADERRIIVQLKDSWPKAQASPIMIE